MSTISVVIPTYNNRRYLAEAIDSALHQSLVPHEVIVVDDGSTDDTRQVLKPYGSGIKYIFQQNQGLAVARNVGLQLATGDYLTYLDGDDVWHEDNLDVKARVLDSWADIGAVFSDFSIFDESGIRCLRGMERTFPYFRRTGSRTKDILETKRHIRTSDGELPVYVGHAFDRLFQGNFILPTSMLIRRKLALDTGFFLAHLRTQQDYEYWLRFSQTHPLALVDEALVSYRRHREQLTDFRNIENMFLAIEEIVGKYEGVFDARGLLPVFNKRKARLLADMARMYVRKGNPVVARGKAVEAMRRNPLELELYLLWLLALVPGRLMRRFWSRQ